MTTRLSNTISPINRALNKLQQLSIQYYAQNLQQSTLTQKKTSTTKPLLSTKLTIKPITSLNGPSYSNQILQSLTFSQSSILFQQKPKIKTFNTSPNLPSLQQQNQLLTKTQQVKQLQTLINSKDQKLKQYQHTITQLNTKLFSLTQDMKLRQKRSQSKQKQLFVLKQQIISLKEQLQIEDNNKKKLTKVYEQQIYQQKKRYEKQIDEKDQKIFKLLGSNSLEISINSLSVDSNR